MMLPQLFRIRFGGQDHDFPRLLGQVRSTTSCRKHWWSQPSLPAFPKRNLSPWWNGGNIRPYKFRILFVSVTSQRRYLKKRFPFQWYLHQIPSFPIVRSATSGCEKELTFKFQPACATAGVWPQDYRKKPALMSKNDPNLLSFEIVLLDLSIKSDQTSPGFPSFSLEKHQKSQIITNNHNWLVVWTPLKNISQLGWLFPIYGKIKNGNQTTNQTNNHR